MTRPTHGSLFSGIGGLDLAVERALGARTIWQVENNPFSRQVLQRHWPRVDRSVDDVHCAMSGMDLGRVDVISGGFPCQDLSSAGKRAGLAGKRSRLFWEFRRVVEELQPSAVLVENVTSGKKLWADVAAEEFNKLGYSVAVVTLAARDVGAPHQRFRTFLVCSKPSTTDTFADMARSVPPHHWPSPPDKPPTRGEPPMVLPYRDADWSKRIAALGNSCVPQQAHAALLIGLGLEVGGLDTKRKVLWPTLVAKDCQRTGSRTGSSTTRAHAGYSLTDVVCRGKTRKAWPTLTASRYGSTNNGCPCDGRTEYATKGTRSLWSTCSAQGGYLNPEWCELFMGFERGWTEV